MIGCEKDGAGRKNYADGIVDEVRISNVGRSSGWAITNYNNYNNKTGYRPFVKSIWQQDYDPPITLIEVDPDTWSHQTPSVGYSMINNFTLYNNGTTTVNVLIGINDTNYTYVNYSTWLSDGHDQYTANFTVDSWGNETTIEPKSGDDPVTTLYNGLANGNNITFGVRIYMPKSVTFAGIREDYKIMLEATEV
jgi:hypothetical protein